MNKETIKHKLIAELKHNSIMLFADRQIFKKDNIPREYIKKQLLKNKKQKKFSLIAFGVLLAILIMLQFYSAYSEYANPLLQNVMLQFFPILGVLFFQINHQNYSKRIFILELLLIWDD